MINPNDPNAYGPKMAQLIEGIMRGCNTPSEMTAVTASMERAAKVLKDIDHDFDAILFAMFIGYGAGGQKTGATVLPSLYKAIEAGYEGRIHELAAEVG